MWSRLVLTHARMRAFECGTVWQARVHAMFTAARMLLVIPKISCFALEFLNYMLRYACGTAYFA